MKPEYVTMAEVRRRARRMVCALRKVILKHNLPKDIEANILADLDAKKVVKRFKELLAEAEDEQ